MGMLDEAIREHLDLKRRQGADPSEIAQLETEALGGGKDAAREADEEVELDEVEEVVAAEEVADDEVAEAEPELVVVEETIVDEEIEPEAGQPTEQFSPEELEAAMRTEPIAEPAAEPEPAADPDPIAQPEPERLEAEVAFEPASEVDESAEQARDELEETPDFLEETPEHDRLWFERKPPRDFDF